MPTLLLLLSAPVLFSPFLLFTSHSAGDIILARKMHAHAAQQGQAFDAPLTFIHDITLKNNVPNNSPEQRLKLREEGIVLFDRSVPVFCLFCLCCFLSSVFLLISIGCYFGFDEDWVGYFLHFTRFFPGFSSVLPGFTCAKCVSSWLLA